MDDVMLARALDAECRRLDADAVTVLAAAARLVASYSLSVGMATAPSREQMGPMADQAAEVFLRALAVHLAHAGVKLRQPAH
jgi:hypothetical protein